MNEHPILFSTPMVQANLDGRKKMTRRTTGLDSINQQPNDFDFIRIEIDPTVVIHKLSKPDKFKKLTGLYAIFENKKTEESYFIKCTYGQPGDLLWVRESFVQGYLMDEDDYFKIDDEGNYIPVTIFKADGDCRWFDGQKFHDCPKWKPSIHMSKSAARIWSQVEEIRVERLQDITEEDAKNEGIVFYYDEMVMGRRYVFDKTQISNSQTARIEFEKLWMIINGRESWDANPWVWVIKYKILSTTGKPEMCYKTNEVCKYDCKGICRESM